MRRIERRHLETRGYLADAMGLPGPKTSPVSVLMTFDPRRTPKAMLVNASAARGATAILAPVFGPPLALPEGVGWNLNRAEFDRAQDLLIGDRRNADATPRSSRPTLLLLESATPPPALWRDGRKLRLFGQGKVFRLSRRQAATRATPGELAPGVRVRLAYYG